MPAINGDHLAEFIGRDPGYRGEAVLQIITAMAKSYTRGEGFNAAGHPNEDVHAVILTASARLLRDPSQSISAESMGPFSISYRQGFDGWSVAELAVLNRYRARAR